MRNEYQRSERERIEDLCYKEVLRTYKGNSYKEMITIASNMADEMEMK